LCERSRPPRRPHARQEVGRDQPAPPQRNEPLDDDGQRHERADADRDHDRPIGGKRGTGGSPGVEFLKQTLFVPVFPDLWAIRHEL